MSYFLRPLRVLQEKKVLQAIYLPYKIGEQRTILQSNLHYTIVLHTHTHTHTHIHTHTHLKNIVAKKLGIYVYFQR
jgi:hypothetical protein